MKQNKKKIVLVLILILLLSIIGYCLYQYIRIKTAKIEVTLKSNLNVEFASSVKVSDMIQSINGTIIDDYKIDTTKLGTKTVSFHFLNDDGIKVPYEYQIEIVDTTEPLIWLGNTYTVTKGSNINLTEKILCGDNYDNNPKCTIEGTYDMNTAGNYELVFKAVDKNGNQEEQPFTLIVQDPTPVTDKQEEQPSEPVEPVYINFNDVVKKYKNKNTRIGIDLSSFQGDVDFKKLKKAGVEFVMIRVGGTKGIDTDYFVDTKFKSNIEQANRYGIDAGIYFYSYAASVEDAKQDAKWVIKQIKKYDIQLPIAFDWENWKYYNDYHLSFFGLTSMAEAFVDEVEKAGYQGMIYSSKTYLENMWMPLEDDIWLAHYTDQTTYQGSYKMWQMCEDGQVDGVDHLVDIDILYLNNK